MTCVPTQIVGSDIGEMTHVVIGHDNSGLGAAWHLSQVEVFSPVAQKTWTFPCDDWLEHTKDKVGAAGIHLCNLVQELTMP
jgi:lipoxygenase homology domain-containing protein 1